MIKLSACMMVRDEEDHLHRCLNSIKDVVDEIIVVDTGSIDSSVAIAESYGAKVYNHPWEKDFSLHRNQSLDYATGDWCFIIDSDEELVFQDGHSVEEVKSFLSEQVPEDFHAIAIVLKDIQKGIPVMEFNSARIFKKGKVRYKGIVHNQPILKEGKSLFCPFIHIRHYGYDLTPEQKQRKRNRTLPLLHKRLEVDPTDYDVYFYLCQLHSECGEKEKAITHGEKYLEMKNKVKNFNESIYFTMIHNYMKTGQKEKACKWLNMGLQDIPNDIDLNMALTEYGVWGKKPEFIYLGARKFVNLFEAHKREPGLSGKRFQYTRNAEALSYCLFHLCVSQIETGTQALTKLHHALDKAKPEFREGMIKDLNRILSKAGVGFRKAPNTFERGSGQKRKLNFGGVI